MKRPEVLDIELAEGIDSVRAALIQRIEKHGWGRFAGPHEGLGVATEEYFELVEAVRSNDLAQVEKENLDLAIACLFSVISSRARTREQVAEGQS